MPRSHHAALGLMLTTNNPTLLQARVFSNVSASSSKTLEGGQLEVTQASAHLCMHPCTCEHWAPMPA